ncbi:MAG: ABC transporter substrate-binding protein [Acidobacteria bacterium]|nr:ABC transporter substrate-binding protein [Acidobacteriota bacterium]
MRTTCFTTTFLLVAALLSVNSTPVASASDAVFPVSVENCGIATTYTEAPRRAFAMNQSATEIMLALGLQDRIIGTAFLDDAILPKFADAYKAIPVRSTAYPSREVLLKAQPDFVYAAYPSAFSSELPGMEDLLHSGADSYLSPSRCDNPPKVEPIEMVFREVLEIGRIFGVPDRAQELVAANRTDLAGVRRKLGTVKTPLRVFWWDSGMPPVVAGCCGAPNEILQMAGAQSIFPDLRGALGAVSWDDVIERNPDVIVLVDASWAPAAQKQEWLLSNEEFSQMDAVKHRRFVTVTFSDATPGIRNIATVRKVAEALYPERFSTGLARHSVSE